ncbi:BmK-YA precursor [Elysia marginata]|uniref:BmK-YA n=1 Tax=Elysia marginata TaxID=1093978 RepID=A0AAV4FD07_9GAST|nr:BmK-YA precursor [Elysia marginata]
MLDGSWANRARQPIVYYKTHATYGCHYIIRYLRRRARSLLLVMSDGEGNKRCLRLRCDEDIKEWTNCTFGESQRQQSRCDEDIKEWTNCTLGESQRQQSRCDEDIKEWTNRILGELQRQQSRCDEDIKEWTNRTLGELMRQQSRCEEDKLNLGPTVRFAHLR